MKIKKEVKNEEVTVISTSISNIKAGTVFAYGTLNSHLPTYYIKVNGEADAVTLVTGKLTTVKEEQPLIVFHLAELTIGPASAS